MDLAEQIFDHNIPEYTQIILNYLEVKDIKEIDVGYEIFEDSKDYNVEEMWVVPREIEIVLEFKNMECPGFTWGWVALCKYKSKKVILEQNASPLMVYYKRE